MKNLNKKSILFVIAVIFSVVLYSGYQAYKQARIEEALVYFQDAQKYAANGQTQDAIFAYREGLQLYSNFENLFNLGNFHLQLMEYQEALDAYSKALAFDEKSPLVHKQLASVYYFIGLNDKAVEFYNKAIVLNPKNAENYSNLGMVYGVVGKSQEAMDNLNKAIQLKPDFSSAYNNLGVEYIKLQNYSKAEEYIKKAIELDPQIPDYYINLFIVYSFSGKKDKADSLIEKVSEIIRQYPNKYIYNSDD